jgi:hypothetical protein
MLAIGPRAPRRRELEQRDDEFEGLDRLDREELDEVDGDALGAVDTLEWADQSGIARIATPRRRL